MVAISFSRGSAWSRDQTHVSCITGGCFTIWATREVKVLVSQLCLILCDPMAGAHQAPLSMEFSRQEYWSGLPFPFSRGSSQPRDWTWFPAMQADSLLSEPPEVFKENKKMLNRKRSKLSLNIYYDHNYVKKLFLYCKKSKTPQRNAMPKNAQTTTQLYSSHTLVK